MTSRAPGIAPLMFVVGTARPVMAQGPLDARTQKAPGWSTCWQGEIAGEYFLSNSNLISHQVRVQTTPTARLGSGVIVYEFLADQPTTCAPGLVSRNIGLEVNAYADWAINGNFPLSLAGGGADPGEVVQRVSGRTAGFALGLLYLAYKY